MYIKKILLAIVLLGMLGLGIFSYFVYQAVLAPNTKFSSETKEVFIRTGASYQEVINQMKLVVKDLESFDQVAQKKSYPQNIKAGRFILKKGMSNNDMVNTLRSSNQPLAVQFNNQERLEDLAGRIAAQIEADSISLIKTMADSTFLAENDFKPETALAMYIPNQYEFYWNTSAKEFRDRMLKEYQKFWTDARKQKAEKIGLTPNEVYTLAAIVQKETAKVDERKRVAGVYMNRHKRGIKLDADPTVIYAVKKKNDDFDTIIKRVLYKDLETDSPYNTYKYAGLPPGPITMPDISAIDAVLNYEDHDYYYFVANPEKPGYHKFAKSLRQHNNNRQAYVRWINKMGINR